MKVRLHGDDRARARRSSGIWPAANWLEREVWDLFGIVFDGHPDPRRLLMPEDWEGYPLRKDYPVQITMKPRIDRAAAGDRRGVPREHRKGSACATAERRCDAALDETIALHRARSPGATRQPIVDAAAAIVAALRGGGKLLVFGNGGSAADAQHVAAELVGRFQRERAALAAIALTTDTSVLTSVANDYAFERVFARQIEALGRPGDVALGISTSGALGERASRRSRPRGALGLRTIALTGRDGGDGRPRRRHSHQRAVRRRRRGCRKCTARCCT